MSAAAVLPATRFPQLVRRPDGVSGRRIAMAGCALLLLLAMVRIHAGEARIRLELDAARQETRRLTVRQEVLRGRIFALARRLEDLESDRVASVSASDDGRNGGGASPLPRRSPSGAGR